MLPESAKLSCILHTEVKFHSPLTSLVERNNHVLGRLQYGRKNAEIYRQTIQIRNSSVLYYRISQSDQGCRSTLSNHTSKWLKRKEIYNEIRSRAEKKLITWHLHQRKDRVKNIQRISHDKKTWEEARIGDLGNENNHLRLA